MSKATRTGRRTQAQRVEAKTARMEGVEAQRREDARARAEREALAAEYFTSNLERIEAVVPSASRQSFRADEREVPAREQA